MELFQRCYPVT